MKPGGCLKPAEDGGRGDEDQEKENGGINQDAANNDLGANARLLRKTQNNKYKNAHTAESAHCAPPRCLYIIALLTKYCQLSAIIGVAMLYRPHRSSLSASMAEAVDVDGFDGLVERLRGELWHWPTMVDFHEDQVHVRPYIGFDDRVGWRDVHIVTIDGYGVMGFTEGPAPRTPKGET